ncbi:MAG TPA: BREX-3 system phosphatase PglZ [Blastocatellia bacterium]|nr:BREX-3 system phosphatase PglZ [Blastocatellia bacterium]
MKEFTPQVSRLTLVADPDGLFLEERLIQCIRERNFEIIPFDDNVAFRFAYESKYRSHQGSEEIPDLIVVLRSHNRNLDGLPYDLLQAGRRLNFGLGDLFPNLSYPIIAALDRSDLDLLYGAQQQYTPESMGDNATKDFVLRHVFQIAPEMIQHPSDLLRVLLRRHYQGHYVPKAFDERFIQVLEQSGRFTEWPLEEIVPDREAFFAFLQERWQRFIARLFGDHARDHGVAAETASQTGSDILQIANLPFDHDDVRVYIDNLFFEGFLKPVDLSNFSLAKRAGLLSSWIAVGVHTDPAADRLRRLDGLTRSLQEQLPGDEARHQSWLAYAHSWAEFLALWHELDAITQSDRKHDFLSLREAMDVAFGSWIEKRYAGLHNQPAITPVMVHHIPRYLARQIEKGIYKKAALIVVDGLALDQWVILREVLIQQRKNLILREDAAFAWVPSITSVSRQAIFAGRSPLFFPASIHTTSKEPALWAQFWIDQGVAKDDIAYVKGLGDEASLSNVEELLADPKSRIVGLVIDKVDRIMHGMELGTAGMHNQVRQWATKGVFARILDLLLENEFEVVITADHGNIEAEGCGRLSEGAIADLRGERVRVYPEQSFRAKSKEKITNAIEWPVINLPNHYFPLIAPSRSAFISQDRFLVGHGGISIEELIVPLIRVERRANE